MPPKKKINEKAVKGLAKYQKELARIQRDPKYVNKPFAVQQKEASKVYQRNKKK